MKAGDRVGGLPWGWLQPFSVPGVAEREAMLPRIC